MSARFTLIICIKYRDTLLCKYIYIYIACLYILIYKFNILSCILIYTNTCTFACRYQARLLNALSQQVGVFQINFNGAKGAKIVRVPKTSEIEGNYTTSVEWDIVLQILKREENQKKDILQGIEPTAGNTDDEGQADTAEKDDEEYLPAADQRLKKEKLKRIKERPPDLTKKV